MQTVISFNFDSKSQNNIIVKKYQMYLDDIEKLELCSVYYQKFKGYINIGVVSGSEMTENINKTAYILFGVPLFGNVIVYDFLDEYSSELSNTIKNDLIKKNILNDQNLL